MLREPARAPLALEQPTALERSLRRVGQVAGEREVVVGERAIVREEDDGHSALGVERDGEQRGEAFLRGRAPGVVEARVRACVRGGHDEAAGAAVGQGRREGRDGSEDVFGKLVAAGEPQRRLRPASAPRRSCRRVPPTRPVRRRRPSRRATAAGPGQRRRGRNRARSGSAGRAPRSWPHAGWRASRARRTPRSPRGRPCRTGGPDRESRRRARRAPRRPRSSARRART